MSLWDTLPNDCKLNIIGLVSKMNFNTVLKELLEKIPKILITTSFILGMQCGQKGRYCFVLFDKFPCRNLPSTAFPSGLPKDSDTVVTKYKYDTSIRWYVPELLSNRPIEYFKDFVHR